MHNFHVVMASYNSPIAEYFPMVDVEIGNELFWYIFYGEPKAEKGHIDLRDDIPGLGLSIKEDALSNFHVIESTEDAGATRQ
jgi:L-rhamnonate dehydratase